MKLTIFKSDNVNRETNVLINKKLVTLNVKARSNEKK